MTDEQLLEEYNKEIHGIMELSRIIQQNAIELQ